MTTTAPSITVVGTKIGETAKAIKFRIEMISQVAIQPRDEWFPFSQVRKIFTDPNRPGEDYLIVSTWIMEQKRLHNINTIPKPVEEVDTYDKFKGVATEMDNFDADDDIPF